MNLSVDFTLSERPANDRVFYGDNRCKNYSGLASDAIDLRRPATRVEISWVEGPCAKTLAQRTFNAEKPSEDRRLPPLPQAVVCGDHDPHVIRFVDGEDAPMRKRALEACVRQLGAVRGRKLMLRCKKGELENQLGCARDWAEKRSARFPGRPVVVGIDGIDQWLTSPRVAASHLQAILDAGATIACAVDERHVDSGLLRFQLQLLGITVIRERSVPKSFASVSPAPEMQRFSTEAKNGTPVRRFPYVHAPTLAAHVAERKHPGAQTTPDNSLDQWALKRCATTGGAGHSALSEYTRMEYARAYRNDFALNRLLRQHFGL
jgi:hypothetical protein